MSATREKVGSTAQAEIAAGTPPTKLRELVAAGIALLTVIIALVMIRVKRSDLEGIDPVAGQTAEPL